VKDEWVMVNEGLNSGLPLFEECSRENDEGMWFRVGYDEREDLNGFTEPHFICEYSSFYLGTINLGTKFFFQEPFYSLHLIFFKFYPQ